MTIGEQIKSIRNEMGLTQTELAGLVGLTKYQTLQMIESGRREPSKPVLEKIADALDCDIVPPQLVKRKNKSNNK